jgi:hypothetical protein
MGVVGIGGEEEWLLFFFCPGKELTGVGEVFFRISSHSGLIVSPVWGKTELTPFGSVFSDHSTEVSIL